MKLSILTVATVSLLVTVTFITYASTLKTVAVKSPSLLHHITGRIPSTSNLVPAPLRHVLSLLGLRSRKVLAPSKAAASGGVLRPSVLSMSPFSAAATNIRPVYTPHVMLPSNHRPRIASPTSPSQSNSGFHFTSHNLPPFLGDPSTGEEPPRLSFVPLSSPHNGMHGHPHHPHHHHQLHHQLHHSTGDSSLDAYGQMLPTAGEKQQVMYIYVDEEGKTVSTKVADPTEGKNITLSLTQVAT